MAEGLKAFGFQARTYPWHTDKKREMAQELANRYRIGCDTEIPNTVPMTAALELNRSTLLLEDQQLYRALGQDCSLAVREVAYSISPSMTEAECAAALARNLLATGITPVVLIVAFDERAKRYRHAHPTITTHIKHFALINITVLRSGLHVSLTRAVHFGALPDELRRRQDAVLQVEAAMLAASRLGRRLYEIYQIAKATFAAVGFPEEINAHHLGGTTSWVGRCRRAKPKEEWELLAEQGVAWNPSITGGAKSEDTGIIHQNGVEIISATPGWPMVEVKVDEQRFARPEILVR